MFLEQNISDQDDQQGISSCTHAGQPLGRKANTGRNSRECTLNSAEVRESVGGISHSGISWVICCSSRSGKPSRGIKNNCLCINGGI